jgi:hypothetical protein
VNVLAAAPDRFTVFCCEATLGALAVAALLYFLLRAFRGGRDRERDRGGPPDEED